MTTATRQPVLPPRVEAAFSQVLNDLARHQHRASALLAESGLPGWCRRSLFFFLGYVAKSNGRVTEQDIGFAEDLIKALKLSPRQRRRAIQQFQNGKQQRTLPALKALGLRMSHRWRPLPALRVALCLCHAAQLHGRPNKTRRYRCEDAVDYIGLDILVVEEVLESYASKVWVNQPEHQSPPKSYEDACKVLGITRRDSLKTIKQTYRKRVSSCHPDKLPRDISPSELALAKERLLRYQQSWDIIRRHHQSA
ncbi:MAG: molecular chaperone DjlA [Marinobacter sp.]|uniref:molecular chaperone DjlA n=1 Tax=Marinobacter sp. TaxID=50741 RepID=UPI00299F1F27|nr:molecular chaperone DjlA [Marinobacter sp.]MDX1756429.1 molecular chaperone DjlA [Marinobacter sp.]